MGMIHIFLKIEFKRRRIKKINKETTPTKLDALLYATYQHESYDFIEED